MLRRCTARRPACWHCFSMRAHSIRIMDSDHII
ncbi:hypothetical protein [Allopusillimonas soli]|uniref:Uncharacterized protein n=1 Tax=Allopusillimonas soli TaxID=659016 RepID=A0A853FAU4_9BURK|nr:hypothetical protein [Allopusillimonas soli]